MPRKVTTKVRGVYEREPGSGVWWVCYQQDGIRRREKVGSRGNAIALYQKRKSELRAGKKLPTNMRNRGVTFAQLAAEAMTWSAEHHPKDIRTVRSRMKGLVAEFGDRTAEGIKPSEIEHWLSTRQDWAPATKNRYRALMSLVFRQAMRNGKAKNNPARLVAARTENNGRIRYLLDEEERALRAVMRERYPSHIPALDVALNTGMRKGEQFSLTWDCVDLKRKQIALDETKNGSSRHIPINSTCLEAFNLLAKSPHKKTDRIFRSTLGEPLNDPRQWFATAMDEANIAGFRWHDLRHTFCSRLVMAGVDIRTVAELAGHKTLAMAMRYAHLAPAHNLNAIEKLHPVA